MYLDFLVPGPNSLLGLSWRPDNRVRTQRSKNPSAMEVSYRRSGRYQDMHLEGPGGCRAAMPSNGKLINRCTIFAFGVLLKEDDERQIWTVRKGEFTRSDLTTSDPIRS